jgi:hypothetical protein
MEISCTILNLFAGWRWVVRSRPCRTRERAPGTNLVEAWVGYGASLDVPKRASFQIGVDWWSHLRKMPRRRWISHTHPVWLWGCSSCKISSPGPVLHWTKWLLWRPRIWSPTLHSSCGINKGLIKMGSTIDHWRSRCKGWFLWTTPYTHIHTYIHTYTHTYIHT